MTRIVITIVPASPVADAEESFRRWREGHPQFVEVATDDAFIAHHIRGGAPGDSVILKRRFDVVVDDSLGELLVGITERLLDIIVIEPKTPIEADREFRAWWDQHPALQSVLGRDGYFVDEVMVASASPLRQYRIRLDQRQAGLLSPR